MDNLSNEALIRIYQILIYSANLCHRTIMEVCVNANYDSRNVFYRVTKGQCKKITFVKIAIGANVPLDLFYEYFECANIQLSPKYSKTNYILMDYIISHQTDHGADYDIDEINNRLLDEGLDTL